MRGDKEINWGTPIHHQRNRTPRVLKKQTPKRLRKCRVTKTMEHNFILVKSTQHAYDWMTKTKPYYVNTADYKCPCGKKQFVSIKIEKETGEAFDEYKF
jgi:hypothetical protein